MQDVLGGYTDLRRFMAFLSDWEHVLARRVDQTVAMLSRIDGVRGLILAGSIGRGEPWPLSDIDVLPVFEDGQVAEAQAAIEGVRAGLIAQWIAEGWWTGIDIGRLYFTRGDLAQLWSAGEPDVMALVGDDRWYHSLDKGYRGRAVYDPDGFAALVATWLTAQRFAPEVVDVRLSRARREVDDALREAGQRAKQGGRLASVAAIRTAVKWAQTWQLERWGERDTSLGRFGTRFERAARARECHEMVDLLNDVSDLDNGSAELRMAAAPAWVVERHDRSWRARQLIREDVTREQDIRDTLRVCSQYHLRQERIDPVPKWLAIPESMNLIEERVARLTQEFVTDPAPPAQS